MMTLDQEIEYWGQQEKAAKSKEAAIIAFGIKAGLKIARAQYGAKQQRG
jgi:hypothetical protein